MRWSIYSFLMVMAGIFMGIGLMAVINSLVSGLIIFSLGVIVFLTGYRVK